MNWMKFYSVGNFFQKLKNQLRSSWKNCDVPEDYKLAELETHQAMSTTQYNFLLTI